MKQDEISLRGNEKSLPSTPMVLSMGMVMNREWKSESGFEVLSKCVSLLKSCDSPFFLVRPGLGQSFISTVQGMTQG